MTAHSLTVQPAPYLRGDLRVPGDKSISHRYLLLGALARGTTRIQGLASGADVASTAACLRALGVPITSVSGTVEVTGQSADALRPPAAPLDAGNSGTLMRLLAGVLAGCPFDTTLSGDASLQRRPMARVIDPLTAMGASIVSREGRAPLEIHGRRLHGIDWTSPVASAQVKSAVLLAGLSAEGTTRVREPLPSRDHTERAFPVFGLQLERRNGQIAVPGGQSGVAPSALLRVPGDPSSAAIWAAAAAARPGSEVTVRDVGLNPLRTGFVQALRALGAEVDVVVDDEAGGEPIGRVCVRYGPRRTAHLTASDVPGLIDELPVLAASAALGGRLEVSGAAELRVKESDRITALVGGLRALGVAADERPDGFVIDGSQVPTGGTVDAALDHRLVMAFAIVGLGASGPTTITGADIVDVSYPGFRDALARIVGA